MSTFSPAVRRQVRERAGGMCERCKFRPGTDFHHRKFKSRGGPDTLANCVLLCGPGGAGGCHGYAHSGEQACLDGWSLHSWEDPEERPAPLTVG